MVANDSSILKTFHDIDKLLITKFSSLNNDADKIIIKNINNLIIDSLEYTTDWKIEQGVSIERVSSEISSNDIDNWQVSISANGGTPGKYNSVSQKEFDVAVENIFINPEIPILGHDVEVTATIKNKGKKAAVNFEVILKDESSSEIIETQIVESLGTNESVEILFNKHPIVVRDLRLVVEIKYNADENNLNNISIYNVVASASRLDVAITEFMFTPINSEPEWIEIYNNSTQEINLKNWSVGDLNSYPEGVNLTSENVILNPNEFAVIARDSNVYDLSQNSKLLIAPIRSLSNSGDQIILFDANAKVIDSLNYSSDWGKISGLSVERLDSKKASVDIGNWRQSISESYATPGYKNSIWEVPNYSFNDVVINEIMFDPDETNSEFVEIYNVSDKSIQIGGWQLLDNSGNSYRIAKTYFLLEPDKYFVLTADSSLSANYSWLNETDNWEISDTKFSLSNEGEAIVVKDLFGNEIDSIYYYSSWANKNMAFTKNKSLEKIAPTNNTTFNWSTSVSEFGATPGIKNSIYSDSKNNNKGVTLSPNPFSPDNDGFEDETKIEYHLSQPIAQVKVKIFDSKGRLKRSLINNGSVGSSGTILFDGKDDNGKPLRIGIYILYMEALNDNSGVVEVFKKAMVVARKL